MVVWTSVLDAPDVCRGLENGRRYARSLARVTSNIAPSAPAAAWLPSRSKWGRGKDVSAAGRRAKGKMRDANPAAPARAETATVDIEDDELARTSTTTLRVDAEPVQTRVPLLCTHTA